LSDVLVAKIGGSTLGSHDTTLDDLAELQRRGVPCVVVHGGGAVISDWLKRMGVRTRFERGLRVTDAESLKVVVAVLAGVVNKELVASLASREATAVGLSGADGGILRARIADPALGFVGEITDVDASALRHLLEDGVTPVVAPVALEWSEAGPTGRLLNTNADTAAGAVAAALGARKLVFLTDVAGVKADGAVLPALDPARAAELVQSGVIEGGMIPKVEACLTAAAAGSTSLIVDGREEHALLRAVEGRAGGTIVG
jgi:acetylglutamate kinase